MKFFLYEIAARILAIYLVVDGVRTLRLAASERKIRTYRTNWLDFLLDWRDRSIYRDESPFWYWLQFGGQVAVLGPCLFVVIFGWHAAAKP